VLNKSVRGAVLLSAIGVLAFALTSAALNLLLPYLLTGDVHVVIAQPERLQQPGQLLALAGILGFFLFVLVALMAFWLYRFFGQAYYGPRGAIRWALFGVLLALLLKLPDWLVPEGLRLVRDILWIVSPFIAFFIARWLVPLKPKSD
jgi:hypothetical protein